MTTTTPIRPKTHRATQLPQSLTRTLPTTCGRTVKVPAEDEPKIPDLPLPANLMIVKPNIDRLVAEQKKLELKQ